MPDTTQFLPNSQDSFASNPGLHGTNEDVMQHPGTSFEQPLAGLTKREWLKTLAGIVVHHGTFKPLGAKHFSAFMEGEEDVTTLLVTFESFQGIRALSEAAEPLGWHLNKAMGWAHLCLASNGDTWFRDKAIYDHFDDLIDNGFFDAYDQVVFYGAGPCGYAASAYSVAAPGSTVVMVQPQATLDPRVTGWDDRFTEMRRADFSSRFGYGPDMIDAAGEVFVIYDPAEHFDAMHAALFTKKHVVKLGLRFMGDAIQSDLIEMQMLNRILSKAGAGTLSPESFAKLYRARRDYPPYLRRVLNALDSQSRPRLSYMLARNVTSRMQAPRFQRRLKQLAPQFGTHEDNA